MVGKCWMIYPLMYDFFERVIIFTEKNIFEETVRFRTTVIN